MSVKSLLVLGIFWLIMIPSRQAQAFKERGHALVEAQAYYLTNRADPKLIRQLTHSGFLEPTEAGGLPIPSSHKADHLVERQFSPKGQCYHFMAQPLDVRNANLSLKYGVPDTWVRTAFYRCLLLFEKLLRATIFDPVTARSTTQGTYALMHMLADSYSSAHAERMENGAIMYLKPWSLHSWLTYAVFPGGWRYQHSEAQHEVSDPRDDQYESADCYGLANKGKMCSGDSRCNDPVVAFHDDEARMVREVVRKGTTCLSKNGTQAAEAMVALFRLLLKRENCTQNPSCPGLDADWVAFQAQYLHHALAELYPRAQWANVMQDFREQCDDRIEDCTPHGDWKDPVGPPPAPPRSPIKNAAGMVMDLHHWQPNLGYQRFGLRSVSDIDTFNTFVDSLSFALQVRLPWREFRNPREYPNIGTVPLGGAVEAGLSTPLSGDWYEVNAGVSLYFGGKFSRDGTQDAIMAGLGGIAVNFFFGRNIVGSDLWIGYRGPRILYCSDCDNDLHYYHTLGAGIGW